jgi:hypothetical protein
MPQIKFKRKPVAPLGQTLRYSVTALSPAVIRAICGAIVASDLTASKAAASVGVAPDTFDEWTRRARQGEPEFVKLVEAVDIARIEVERKVGAVAVEGALHNSGEAMRFLERKRPEDWGNPNDTDFMIGPNFRVIIHLPHYNDNDKAIEAKSRPTGESADQTELQPPESDDSILVVEALPEAGLMTNGSAGKKDSPVG